jgi:hypothetical protein
VKAYRQIEVLQAEAVDKNEANIWSAAHFLCSR